MINAVEALQGLGLSSHWILVLRFTEDRSRKSILLTKDSHQNSQDRFSEVEGRLTVFYFMRLIHLGLTLLARWVILTSHWRRWCMVIFYARRKSPSHLRM